MSTTQQRRLRYRFQGRQIAILTLVWLCLWGHVSLVSVAGGILVSWLVTVAFPMPPVHYYGRLHPWGLVKLLAALLRDLAQASVSLAGYAFTGRRMRPGILKVQLDVKSDLYQVNIAQMVSIVPGTIVVDARRRTRVLYLHVFDLPDAAAQHAVIADTGRVERRLVQALGSEHEIEALEAAGGSEDEDEGGRE